MADSFDAMALTQIGRFPVRRFLAEGGMSWVYEVEDPNLYGARRALKLLKPHFASTRDLTRFLDEVKILATVEHPNLVRVYELGQDEGTGCHFYVMEYIEGLDLSDVKPEWMVESDSTITVGREHSLERICGYFMGVLSALSRVHERGIFHRDIKPENISVSVDGAVKLADFGIAKQAEAAGVTQEGFVTGTPRYMSPEHSMGQEVTAQSDLFSLGLTLYRVLTGHTVYELAIGSDTTTQMVLQHLWQLHGSHREFDFSFPDEIPEALRDVVRTAGRIDPAERYRNAEAMRVAIERALRSLAVPHPVPGGSGGLPTWARWTAVGGVATALAVGGGFLAVGAMNRAAERGRVEALRDQTAGLRERALAIATWVAERPNTADLSRAVEDRMERSDTYLRDGIEQLESGEFVSATRSFRERAHEGYIRVCDRISEDYLRQESGRVYEKALQVQAGIPQTVPEAVAQEHAEWQRAAAGLESEVAEAGCDKAEGLQARVETSERVVSLGDALVSRLAAVLPDMAASAIAQAEAASPGRDDRARGDKTYRAELARADAALKTAQALLRSKKWEEAIAGARGVARQYKSAARMPRALAARNTAAGLVERASEFDVLSPLLQTAYQDALGRLDAGEWDEATESLQGVTAELRDLLARAEPAARARADAEAAQSEAEVGNVSSERLAPLDADLTRAHRAFRGRSYEEASEIYATVAEGYRGQVGQHRLAVIEQGELDKVQKQQRDRALKAQTAFAVVHKKLKAEKVPDAAFKHRIDSARERLEARRDYAAAEDDYRALERDVAEFLDRAREVIAARSDAVGERAKASSKGVPTSSLAAATRDLEDAAAAFDRGNLGEALGAYTSARDEYVRASERHLADKAAGIAQTERDKAAAKVRLAKLHGQASEARTAAKKEKGSLDVAGLKLGGLKETYDAAERDFQAKSYETAKERFDDFTQRAGLKLRDARPALDARSRAEAVRREAEDLGATIKDLKASNRAFKAAGRRMGDGDFAAAEREFGQAGGSYQQVVVELQKMAAARGEAEKARAGARKAQSGLADVGISISALEAVFDRARRAFDQRRYEEAKQVYADYASQARSKLEEAGPVLGLRRQIVAARTAAGERGAVARHLADPDRQAANAESMLAGGRFGDAQRAFNSAIATYQKAGPTPEEHVEIAVRDWNRGWDEKDIEILKRTEKLDSKRVRGISAFFTKNEILTQSIEGDVEIRKMGAVYEARFTYHRSYQEDSGKRRFDRTTARVARLERVGDRWMITEWQKP